MKNQYFGDVYDYLKYSLLGHLTGHGGIHSAICWMLTENDQRRDGHRIEYLQQADSWSKFDPTVYSFLQHQVLDQKRRDVKAVEDSHLLANSRFYSDILSEDSCERQSYFKQFLEFSGEAALVFFDPDNGIEIKSVKYGRRLSSKYLYWAEIEQCFAVGHTLLIYQHLPPKPRDQFINTLAGRFSSAIDARVVYSISTKRVVFFLVPQKENLSSFRERVSGVEKAWTGVAQVREHLV